MIIWFLTDRQANQKIHMLQADKQSNNEINTFMYTEQEYI